MANELLYATMGGALVGLAFGVLTGYKIALMRMQQALANKQDEQETTQQEENK